MIEVFPIFLKKLLVGWSIFLADQNLRTRVPVGCAIQIAVRISNLIGEVVSPSLVGSTAGCWRAWPAFTPKS
jgi:hypothetical protein